MKKVIIYLTTIVLALGIIVFFFYNNHEDYTEKETQINISPDVRPISEVSANVLKDMEEAGKISSKLEFDDIIPYCPDVKSVSDINYSIPDNYKGIVNEKDILTEQLELVEILLDKDITELKMECFESGYYNQIEKGDYAGFEDFLDDDEKNEKRKPEWLSYLEHDEENLEYVEIKSCFEYLFFIKGKCYELSYDNRMNEKDGLTMLTQPRFVCEKVEEYYVYENNNRLEEKWKLSDGEISVREGIEFTENYLNEMVELEGENKNVELKVAYVEVYRINNEIYCFRYRIRRSIGDVLCQSLSNGSSIGALNLNYDMSDAYQVELNKIDMYDGPTKRLEYEKENETSSILPLSKAIEILENNLGNNSKYQVQAIELGYLSLYDDNMIQDKGSATVCWYFQCINEQDQWITEFYVNALTGEINTYVRH